MKYALKPLISFFFFFNLEENKSISNSLKDEMFIEQIKLEYK
jgi:hypothetical protein